MKLSAQWIRDFVDLTVDDRRLAEDLTSIGVAVEGIFGDRGNTVFEMEIGTNRPDAMNHYGVAREASAFYRTPLRTLDAAGAHPVPGRDVSQTALEPSSTPNRGAAAISKAGIESSGSAKTMPVRGWQSNRDFEIAIEDAEGCARYTAQIVRGVTIQPAPEKIAGRLGLVDQRAINNVADASNYTLWEMGHPTHAFDLDLITGGRIIVRRAHRGETLRTLDGVDRKLSSEDLIIADGEKPVALAGVMGGFDTMITEHTKNVLIESAWFDPAAVRKGAKRHGLHTDASHRFERGADYGATPAACSLVARRILESGGGELEGGQIDAVARELAQSPVVLRISEVERILGSKLQASDVLALLERLGFQLAPEPGSGPQFSVHIPTWRLDVEREIDVIEEVARLYGYDKFPNTLPAFSGAVGEDPRAQKQARLRNSLLALGYNEALSLTFVSHEDAEAFSSTPVVELHNPLSAEASLMRSSLVPGMLNMLAYNLNRGTEIGRLFEIGDIYEASGLATREHRHISLGATISALRHDLPSGEVLDKSQDDWGQDAFRLFKGDLETLLTHFAHTSLELDSETPDYYARGRSAKISMDGEVVAQFGALDPGIGAGRKLRQEVLVAEIFADRLYSRPLREIVYQALPKFPAVERDFSFLFDGETTFSRIAASVHGLHLENLRSFRPQEIFRGGTVPRGKYSILVRARFQSLDHTLREEEVNDWAAKIVKALTDLGGTQRA